MSKDAFYFSHDSNARNDQRLMKIRMKYGMQGYGVYFGIIEILREQSDYTLMIDEIEGIAFDLRVELDVVKDIINNYNLFEINKNSFFSRSLSRRMEKLDLIKQKRADAGRIGGKSKANAKAKVKQNQASKVKESKVNNIKVNNIKERFDKFNNECFNYQSEFSIDLIKEFVNYWSEPNKSKTKMKFELNDTWDTKRRLQRWDRNNFSKDAPVNSLDQQILERNKNQKKESIKLIENIKKADEEATDYVPDLKAMMKNG